MSPSLDVYLGAKHVGSLTRPGSGRLSFTYETDSAEARLSVSLPVQTARFPNARTRPFFEGLLPEGASREQIARLRGLSADNAFGLLAEIGAECAGAVVILPSGSPLPSADMSGVAWLTDDELAARIADLPTHPLGVGSDVRLSLGGVQEKLLVTQAPDGRFSQPSGGAPSTHIIKPSTHAWEGIAINEAFCLRLAQSCDLPTVRFELVDRWRVSCLVVERFDRETNAARGTIHRLHQEDMCQALGRLPREKYQAESGPSCADVTALLRAESTAPALDINNFVRAVAFNYLIGNSDAHGKNFALLYGADGLRLAPLYDLVCTAAYPGLTKRMAMFVGAEDDPGAVAQASWLQLAADCGVNGPLVVRAVRELANRVRFGAAALAQTAKSNGWHAPIIDEIVSVIVDRAGRT